MSTLCFFVFFSIVLSTIYIGLKKSKGDKTEEAYLFANRKNTIFPLTATLVMTEMNTSTIVSFSSVACLTSYRALLLPLIFLVGLVFYSIVVAKKWKESNCNSISEVLSKQLGSKIGKLSSVCLLTAMLGFNATYLKSLALLFKPFAPNVSEWTISLIMVGTILLISIKNGLVSIVKTDVFSFFIFVAFFSVLVWFCFANSPPLPSSLFESFSIYTGDLPTTYILSLIVITMFTYILAPWYGQKIFSAKNPKTAFISTALSAVIVFIFYSAVVFATSIFIGFAKGPLDHQTALPLLIKSQFPKGLMGLAFSGLFLACATTLTSSWSAMASMIINDFSKKITLKQSPFRSMMLTVIFAISTYILSNTLIDEIFPKLILSNIPISALAFSLLSCFYWKKISSTGSLASIVVGVAGGIISYIVFGEEKFYTMYWAFGAIPLSFVVGVIVSVVFPDKEKLYQLKKT